MKLTNRFLITLFCVLTASQAMAVEAGAEVPDFNHDTLSGDWGGVRTDWYKKGIDLGFTHKSDLMSNVSGGLQRGTTWIGHTEARATFDLEKLLGWNATTAFVHFHSDLGGKLNSNYVGGFVGEDNVEVSTNTAQFYQAWLQKNFLDDQLSILAGLYAIDTEYYLTETSGLFLQAPYGMANEFAQTGKNGPPIFPLGALAIRVKYVLPNQHLYIQVAITDGVPGDPNDPHGTHIMLGDGDGTLSIVEFGYHLGHSENNTFQVGLHKLGIGLWGYSTKFEDLMDTDVFGNPIMHRSQGAYVTAEGGIYKEAGTQNQGLNAFMRFGVANKNINQADWSSSVGFTYQGLIIGRDEDVLGAAVTINHASNKYRLLENAERAETDYEVTYRTLIYPWLALQPTIQLIQHPNMDKSIENAYVLGFRTEVTF